MDVSFVFFRILKIFNFFFGKNLLKPIITLLFCGFLNNFKRNLRLMTIKLETKYGN